MSHLVIPDRKGRVSQQILKKFTKQESARVVKSYFVQEFLITSVHMHSLHIGVIGQSWGIPFPKNGPRWNAKCMWEFHMLWALFRNQLPVGPQCILICVVIKTIPACWPQQKKLSTNFNHLIDWTPYHGCFVAYFIKEVNPNLAKPPLKFN